MIRRPESGLYAILLRLGKEQTVRIGRKGRLNFASGYYVYIGSARKGPASRLARHRSRVKPPRWHIDYLRPHARWLGAWTVDGDVLSECGLAGWFRSRPGAATPVPGFGASDCRCGGHLVHFGRLEGTGIETGRPLDALVGSRWFG